MDINYYQEREFWNRVTSAVKFQENGLFGLKSPTGEIILEAQYDKVEVCADFVYAHYGNRHKFYYKNGRLSDCLDDEDDHRFYDNGKIGLLYSDGTVFLPAEYDKIIEWRCDSDVVYVRKGREYHYYNHNKEKILTDVQDIEEDAYPECPYNLGEDQNRNVLLCVEPIQKHERNSDCFAYGQWVRLSRIRYKDVRNIFSDCEVVGINQEAIDKFEDECTYIYSARKYSSKNEYPITTCIEKFKTLDCYDVSWNYLLKISINKNTAINPHDLYNAIKFFENIEYGNCIRYDIAIAYDESLEDGEVEVLQIHYFWDDMGEFLYDRFRQVTLCEGTLEEIEESLNILSPQKRRKMLSEAYWWIRYSEKRNWEETEKVLSYLKSEGCNNITLLIREHLDINPYYMEEISPAEWLFKKDIISWAISNGGQLNYIHNGMTLYEEFVANLDSAKERKEDNPDAIASIENAEEFAKWLKDHGAITASEQRKIIESKLEGLSPSELLILVKTT